MNRKIITLMACLIMILGALVVAIPTITSGGLTGTAPPPYPSKRYSWNWAVDARDVWFSPTELEAGQPATIYVQTYSGNRYYSHNVRAWVDWNQDGDWNDAGEMVYSRSHWNHQGVWTGSLNINVPANAVGGTTWVRACSQNSGYPGPSGSGGHGGVVDRQVVINAGIPALVDTHPETLNLDSMGNWVSVLITDFPDDPDVDPSEVIDGTVELENIGSDPNGPSGYSEGAYHCKVDRLLLEDAIGAPGDSVELTIKGDVADTSFEGTCTIRAIHGI